MDAEGKTHCVEQGESTTRLAYENGLFWKTVWNHPNNAELRVLRKDQNVLYPGDEIFIPTIRPKVVTAATGERHRFQRLGIPEKLNVQFLGLDGQPLANEAYVLRVDGDSIRGNLDGEGWLRVPIPPEALLAQVRVGQCGELAELDLALGHLDPVTELTGVQARLRNLGFYQGSIDGNPSEELTYAVRAFRLKYKLDQAPEEQEDGKSENAEPEQDVEPQESELNESAPQVVEQQDAADDYQGDASEEDDQVDTIPEEELDPDHPDYESVYEEPAETEEEELQEVTEDAQESEEEEDSDQAEDDKPDEGDREEAESAGIDDAFRKKLREVHGV
jgi:hypothetical protein